MESLPSTEFRKRFARLTKPTIVTVNGHIIGEWRPFYDADPRHRAATEAAVEAERFNTRPFTPVPKVKK